MHKDSASRCVVERFDEIKFPLFDDGAFLSKELQTQLHRFLNGRSVFVWNSATLKGQFIKVRKKKA